MRRRGGRIRVEAGARGIGFECRRCALCCSTGPNVSLTIFDVIRLAERVGVGPRDFLLIYSKVVVADFLPFAVLAGDHRGRCVFLELEGGRYRCKVYECRPMRCRLYPALPLSPGLSTLELDEKCPGWFEDERGVIVDAELYETYSREVREHYARLYRLIFEEGLEPFDALVKASLDAARCTESGRRAPRGKRE
ncbi:MAG: YkgJ family cysteine cluster protein [Fervidicoccaceae archaeon]